MCNKQRGMTLIELVLAIVIISVGLTGVLAAFQYAVKASADPMIRKQMLAIAEEMMEEITLKPIVSELPNVIPVGCERNTYNDIDDYEKYPYATPNVCDIEGHELPSLTGYKVTVMVVSGFTLDSSVPANKILVTVEHGTEKLSLTSYRTGWAL